jgi:hypothetical protein
MVSGDVAPLFAGRGVGSPTPPQISMSRQNFGAWARRLRPSREETRGSSRRRAAGRGGVSIGDTGFKGGNVRKRGRWRSCSDPEGPSRFQVAASNRSIVQEAGVSVA